MPYAAEALVSLAVKAIIMLPLTWVVQYLTDRLLRFRSQFLYAYAALLGGNMFYSLLGGLVFAPWLTGPHGGDPGIQLIQIALRFALLFVCQTLLIFLLFRSEAGARISPGKAVLVGLGLVAVPVAMTSFAWIFAV